MKTSFWFSCTALYLLFNEVQISSSDPITGFIGFVSSIVTIWAYIESKVPQKGVYQRTPEFFEHLKAFKFSQQQLTLSEEIKMILNEMPIRQNIGDYQRFIEETITKINHGYQVMLPYKHYKLTGQKLNQFDFEKMNETAHDSIGIKGDVYVEVEKLHNYVIGEQRNDLVSSSLKLLKQNTMLTCSTGEKIASFQQALSNIFSGVFIAYMKGYFTIRFSEQFINQYYPEKEVSHSHSLKDTMENLEIKINETIASFKAAMESSPRDLWLCDPEEHVEGVTFETLSGSFHKQLIPQNLLTDPSKPSDTPNLDKNDQICKLPCDVERIRYPAWEQDPSKATERHLRKQHFYYQKKYPVPWAENLFECKRLHSFLNIDRESNEGFYEFYDFSETPYKAGNMKFRQFTTVEIPVGGNKITANFDEIPRTKTQRVYVNNDTPCDICLCTADESFVYYSTENVMADKDHVITGVRLLSNSSNYQLRKLFHFQIQQGKLLGNGTVDKSSVKWKPVDYDAIWKNWASWNMKSAPISYKFRNIDIFDIDLPSNQVMVGIGFDVNSNKAGVYLKISGRTFDFATGEINHSSTQKHSIKERRLKDFRVFNPEEDLYSHRIPKLGDTSTVVNTNITIMYGTSNFDEDLSQTTVPYWDIQEIVTSEPTPLGGAGLYYKHHLGYAGYIGLKLKTYNFMKNINNNKITVEDAANLVYDKILGGDDIRVDIRNVTSV